MASATLSCFFFFQAEDGIRDVAVTGVQTCALPICFLQAGATLAAGLAIPPMLRASAEHSLPNPIPGGLDLLGNGHIFHVYLPGRSEERRVGKECRSRWSPYH